MAREPFKYRDADGNLRLDEALGEEHVRHYIGVISGANAKFADAQAALAMSVVTPKPGQPGDFYSWQEMPHGPEVDGHILTEEGAASRLASSCTDLQPLPVFVWDVCGYYRRLGLHWRATKVQIVRAQLEHDPGRDDSFLSYAVAQLLDPVIRWAYDLQELGALFLGDRYVQDYLKRQAAQAASNRNAEAWLAGERNDDPVTAGDILREVGLDSGVSDHEAKRRLAEQYMASQGEAPGGAESALGATMGAWERQWGWYRLTGPYDPYEPQQWPSPRVLEAWQAMVGAALSEAGVTIQFSVGIWPGHGWKNSTVSKFSCIFFIGNGPPDKDMAREAVTEFLAHQA